VSDGGELGRGLETTPQLASVAHASGVRLVDLLSQPEESTTLPARLAHARIRV